MITNWRTSLAGILGGTTATTALVALSSDEFYAGLTGLGVEPMWLIIFAGIMKIIRDVCAKDAVKPVEP